MTTRRLQFALPLVLALLAVTLPAEARPSGREWFSLGKVGGPTQCWEIFARHFRGNWQIVTEQAACTPGETPVSNPALVFSDHTALVPLSNSGTQVLDVFGDPTSIEGAPHDTGIGPVLVYGPATAELVELSPEGESVASIYTTAHAYPTQVIAASTLHLETLFSDVELKPHQAALVSLSNDRSAIVGFGKKGDSVILVPNGEFDVGIIPEHQGECPPGSEYIVYHMDDEDGDWTDDPNISSTSGWTGAIHNYGSSPHWGGTEIAVCRVNGYDFASISAASYAVLQLSEECPPNAWSFRRKFTNEDNNNQTRDTCVGECKSDSYDNITTLYFCFFPKSSTSTATLPNYQMSYGVWGLANPVWLASGEVFTDDEDGSNANALDCGEDNSSCFGNPYLSQFSQIVQGGANTLMHTVWARNDACLVACPNGGGYDGKNCYYGTPPSGTQAFVYSRTFYSTPLAGPTCQPGDWFDGLNCQYTSQPSLYDVPFVWSNKWYVVAACHP